MKLQVEKSQRYAKMRAHTATHLLHAELAKIFPNTKQEGSQVDSDYLRFDFKADRILDQQELANIEKKLNQIIYLACDVVVDEMTIDEASKLGAKMFFEDKYGDVVRVVRIKNTQIPIELQNDDIPSYFASFGEFLSLELCGGTHVENTKDIGAFTILSQEAVASGVKRISAITGPRVLEKLQEVQGLLDITVAKLGIKTATQISDRLDKVLKEYDELKSVYESMESKIIISTLKTTESKTFDGFDKVLKVSNDLNFKNVSFQAKGLFENQNILIYNDDGNFVILSNGVSAKELSNKVGLKGGGNDNMVQGRDVKVLEILK